MYTLFTTVCWQLVGPCKCGIELPVSISQGVSYTMDIKYVILKVYDNNVELVIYTRWIISIV